MIVALAVEPWGSTRPPPEPTPSPYRAPNPSSPSPRSAPADRPLCCAAYRPEAFGPEPAADATWTIRTPRPWSRRHPSPSRIRSTSPVDRSSTWARRRTSTSSSSVGQPGPDSMPSGCGVSTTAAIPSAWTWRDSTRPGPLRLPGRWACALPEPPPARWRRGRLACIASTCWCNQPAGSGWSCSRCARVAARTAPSRSRRVTQAGGRRRSADRPAAPAPRRGQPLDGRLDPHRLGTATRSRELPVAQIWLARGPEQGCWAVPIGPTSALGVNLPDGQRVTGIELAQVDPLPGPVALTSQVGSGKPWRRGARDPSRWPGRSDTYRMSVALVGGGVSHWYLEVGPDGRQAAEINAFVTSAQR